MGGVYTRARGGSVSRRARAGAPRAPGRPPPSAAAGAPRDTTFLLGGSTSSSHSVHRNLAPHVCSRSRPLMPFRSRQVMSIAAVTGGRHADDGHRRA